MKGTGRVIVLLLLATAACREERSLPSIPVTAARASAEIGRPMRITDAEGFTAVPIGGEPQNVGVSPSIVAAPGGVAMAALIVRDPNNDGDDSDSTVQFVRWDPAARTWSPPSIVDQVTAIFPSSPQIQLARDSTDGTLVLAYRRNAGEIWLATSHDDGSTWTKEEIAPAPDPLGSQSIDNPSVAISEGRMVCAFVAGEKLLIASSSSALPAVSISEAPALPGGGWIGKGRPSVAADGDCRIAVAWLTRQAGSNTQLIAFWRTDETIAYRVADLDSARSAPSSMSLAFAGTKPRIAFEGPPAGDASAEDGATWFVASDDGRSWNPAQQIPQDGDDLMQGPLALAIDHAGGAAIVSPSEGSRRKSHCGKPKLARSDDLQNWMTCSPDRLARMAFETDGANLAFDPDGKLWIAFHNVSSSSHLPPGLIVWRSP